MYSPFIFSVLFSLSLVLARPDLFDDGQRGRILGSSFGIPGINATFDYVILGGGTAGLTIAARLAEDLSLTVAVVEAGGFYEVDNGDFSVIPARAVFGSGSDPKDFQPLVDWGFVTTPQAGVNNRVLHYPRGKTLGGSSARNYMFYHRGTADCYNKWADQVGDQSYSFLPYFKKSVKCTPPNQTLYTNSSVTEAPAAFSKFGGPLQVSFSNFVDPFGTWAQRALIAVGLNQIDGFNSGKLIGSAYGTLTINPKNAHRSSSESSFLQNAIRNRTTLLVYKNTLAQRILFDSNNTATSVAVTTAGTYGVPSVNYTLFARKEVIISGGAFQSPQLLMVSGIGPRSTLQKYGIPCLKDLTGVGQNLWDHVIYGIAYRVNVLTASASINDPAMAAAAAEAYLANATGPLSVFGAGYYGWEKLPEPFRSRLSASSRAALQQNFPADWPEIEYLPISGYFGYQENANTDPRDGYNYAQLNAAIVSPLSRGTVSIQGREMTTPPLIDPNWLTNKADVELAIQSFRRLRQMWKVLADQGLTIGDEYLPSTNVTTDAQILDFISRSLIEVYHAAATCKMGVKTDPLAVVDSSARVFGTKRLRVVDASSFPFLPPGHPQATIYALAEKIAEDILHSR
ncbi:hypothetical protein MMC31_004802 [Peltigera leucophlebia]|nr:hypothetical protein [Peltigera leucophlebia]